MHTGGVKRSLAAQVVGQLAAFTDELARFGAAPPNAVRQHTPPLLADTWLSLLTT